jgi:O-antigen/teichoic acid export membrane protein
MNAMGQIRRQVIYSSVIIYIGFFIGFINTYVFIRNGTFTPEQYGLTRLISDIGVTLYSFATFGVLNYVYKFFPYYKANLKPKENDQLTWTLVVSLAGFILVAVAALLFRPLIVKKFSARSALLVKYYYWILPFTFGFLVFSVLEAFAWFSYKSTFTNFLKETALRLFQSALLILFVTGWVQFSLFVKLFSLSFIFIAIILAWYLRRRGALHITFKVSTVSRRLSGKIIPFMMFLYSSQIIVTLAQYIDGIIIASISTKGLADAGIYTLAAFIANTIQVPQRSIIAATIPVLSHAWRERRLEEISRIYNRSSINLLLLSLFFFFLIWMNINDIFDMMKVNTVYKEGYSVLLFLAIARIIDAGTGVNSQIIGTSHHWRFDVVTGIILLVMIIPLNYFLVKRYDILGSGIANLISLSVYNAIRLYYIWKKFRMQPFTIKTLYALLLALLFYGLCYWTMGDLHGIAAVIARSALFSVLFVASVFAFNLTPDAAQLLHVLRQKLNRRKGEAG